MKRTKQYLYELLGPRLLDFCDIEDGVVAAEFMGTRFSIMEDNSLDGGFVLQSTSERDQYFRRFDDALASAYAQAVNMLRNEVKVGPLVLTNTELAMLVEQMAEDLSTLLRENTELREELSTRRGKERVETCLF